jgi:hypothetical protein
MEDKVWITRKKILTSIEIKFFSEEQPATTAFIHKRNEEILKSLKVQQFGEKLKKIQIKMATTCNKAEQQQDVKNIAEL